LPTRRKNTEELQQLGQQVAERLGDRTVVMVGLMGCGKSSVGRRIANRLSLPFVDADDEIVKAAGQSIADIFQEHGEAHFREGEKKVIARILNGNSMVLATGGGAFMTPDTRAAIKAKGVSVWLKADLPLLMRRVARRDHRPLLKTGNPEKIMRKLMDERYPVYATADITVESRDVAHEVIVHDVLNALLNSPALAPTSSV
jgi:shikimate kinase